MAVIAWVRAPAVWAGPLTVQDGAPSGQLVAGQRLARALGAGGAAAVLLSGHLGISIPPLGAHRMALAALFVFLLVAQYRQVAAVVLCLRPAPLEVIASHYRRLWQMTEIAPAPIALILLASGLRLVARGYSPSASWLCVLIVAFGFLFFDGILEFTPLTRLLKDEGTQAALSGEAGALRSLVLSRRVNLRLLGHCGSFPFLALCGYLKPNLPNPLAGAIGALDRHAGAAAAVMALFLLGGIVAIAARRWRNR